MQGVSLVLFAGYFVGTEESESHMKDGFVESGQARPQPGKNTPKVWLFNLLHHRFRSSDSHYKCFGLTSVNFIQSSFPTSTNTGYHLPITPKSTPGLRQWTMTLKYGQSNISKR
jgi:hypothetical protein